MIKNYFTIAIRYLSRNKVFSFINVMGLSIGISSCLLMTVFVYDELTFDQFHTKAESIYRVAFNQYMDLGGYASTPLPIGPTLKEEISEIEYMTRVQFSSDNLVRFNNVGFFEDFIFVDQDFFQVFDFNLVKGNEMTVFSEPNQIVLTVESAKKYFGDEDPIGKMLQIGSSGRLNSIVTGVVEEAPGNSQFKFDFLMSINTYDRLGWATNMWTQMPGNYTYVVLKDNALVNDVSKRINEVAEKYVAGQTEGKPYSLTLQPLAEIHLNSNLNRELPSNANRSVIYISIVIAAIILIIAWINYINLTSARYSQRVKEIGVRKSYGATRPQLITQFLGESILLSILATLFALLITDFLLSPFNDLVSKSIPHNYFLQTPFLLSIILFALITGLGAGIFPSLFLTRLYTSSALRSKVSTPVRGITVRKALVAGQFFASIVLIAATIIVFDQMTFIKKSLTINDQEQVIVFPINSKLYENFKVLRDALSNNTHIIDVSGSSSVPSFYGDSWPLSTTLDGPGIQTENYVVEDNYLDVMNYQLIAGRNLDHRRASDSTAFIINETAVRELGFGSPESAIGHTLYWGGDDKVKGEVVGVTKDFFFESFKEKINPALLHFPPYDWMTYNFVVAKINPERLQETISFIMKSVAAIDENWIVDYTFFDKNFQAIHDKDIAQGRLLGVFSVVAVLISCMGLLGLVMLSATQRSKEIGIRKVLGASEPAMVFMLIKEFVKLFLIAFAMAIPVTFLIMNNWLQSFVYHVEISASIFVVSGLVTFSILLLTVGYQAIVAATANPVTTLRSIE